MGKRKEKKVAKAAAMSVGERRAAAKSAGVSLSNFKQGNTGAKYQKSAPAPSPSPSPSPSSSPSPSPSPAPRRQQAKAAAQMSVKDRRAGAKAAGVSISDFKQGKTGAKAVARKTAQVNKNNRTSAPIGGVQPNSFSNAQLAGTGKGGGLVKARRNAAANSGMSMAGYRAGVSSGLIDKHGRAKRSGGVTNQSGGSAWENMNSNFNQGEWDSHVKNHWDKYSKENRSKGDGLANGPAFGAAQWGENGLKMDANAPMMIPKLGEYGFKRGDHAFDVDGFTPHQANMDGRGGAHVTGRIAYMKLNGEAMPEFDGESANPNWDKYAASGSERLSSEGLYQDRYNVGYHGADDKGDTYASQASLGNIGDYFKDYKTGDKSFGAAYNFFAGGNRKDGYAGDVLKMIDQGHMKVSDDDYNMLVTDASNYDWDNRNEIAGRDAGSDSYDARTGGESQNNITANENFYKNRDAGYHMAGSMDHEEAAAKYGNTSQNFGSQESDFAAPTQAASNFEMPNVQQSMGPQYQGWQEQMSNSSKPYASRSKSSMMNFNFSPYKFQQGQ